MVIYTFLKIKPWDNAEDELGKDLGKQLMREE